MSTFRGVFTCEDCNTGLAAHGADFSCPREPSQPLSRVVAGPVAPALTAAERDMLDLCSRYENGDGFDGAGWDDEAEQLRRRHGFADVYGLYDVGDQLEARGLVNEQWDLAPAGRAALDATKPADEPPPSASLVATVAALRALTPEQRAALVQIGEDAADIIDALEHWHKVVIRREWRGSIVEETARANHELAAVLARIERRRPST